ncbi:unnamed protein product [Sphagnum troendelagicum]|uniref:Uncharacterized protein n=1 Tax=Sphagnum troendelagicum TaxID=128251 RepID=A0ABP0TTG2_9BRYO
MARSNATSGRKQHRNAAAGVVQNKVTSPAVKFTDMRAAAGQRMSVLGAKMGEKMVHLRADVALGFYRIRHPVHPVRRVAAAEATKEMKAAATERRRQKEARARDKAARQRAVVRERRAYNMAKHT